MDIQLIQEEFNSGEALELIAHMAHIKIKHHENNINEDCTEEDIKTREAKIKLLQKELFELTEAINSTKNKVKVEAIIKIEKN